LRIGHFDGTIAEFYSAIGKLDSRRCLDTLE